MNMLQAQKIMHGPLRPNFYEELFTLIWERLDASECDDCPYQGVTSDAFNTGDSKSEYWCEATTFAPCTRLGDVKDIHHIVMELFHNPGRTLPEMREITLKNMGDRRVRELTKDIPIL